MATDPNRPLKVFLCHAHSDRDAVKALYARLKREGVDVWLDKEKLLPGADWEYEIRKAVREADVVVVCLSKQFNQDGFRQKEVRIALDAAMEKREGEIFIIPARLEECDTLESLRKWHWVDLFESDGFQRLIMALRVRAGKIGATLRQRGATVKKSDAEKEGQRLAKEKADREEADRITREKADREAIEKARLDAEEKERQKLAKEQVDREEADRIAREKADRDAIEKARLDAEEKERQRLAKEQADREEADRIAREKADRDAIEKARLDAEEKERQRLAKEQADREAKEKAYRKKPRKTNTFVIIGSVLLVGILFVALINSPLFGGSPSQIPEPTATIIPPTGTATVIQAVYNPHPESDDFFDDNGVPMRLVPAGEFTMGSEKYDDEKPIHQVYLDDFYMDKYEVTNILYKTCVEAGNCTPPKYPSSTTHSDYYINSTFNDYPVIFINWDQAKVYCEWRGAGLPTESQWEKAARGTDGRTYPWGERIDANHANYNSNKSDTTKVGSYESGKSPYGIYDMAGNVWEWVNDWYDGAYYQGSPSSNPLGPSLGQYRVLRGGSWYYYDLNVRSTFRSFDTPDYVYGNIGFRCARSLP